MGYQNVHETRLQELRNKHRPAVKASLEERLKGIKVFRDSHGLASKLYGFKKAPGSVIGGMDKQEPLDTQKLDDSMANGVVEQVVWLKVELCKLLEEKRSSELRAEEIETTLMEMVKQDNRRQLSARVEQLEREVVELRQALADKQKQENAMHQILMRVEQEQKVTEEARVFAEQEAVAKKYAAQILEFFFLLLHCSVHISATVIAIFCFQYLLL